MNKMRLFVVVFICQLAIPIEVDAALIELDLFSSGDGLITQDTETGLEWLDLTSTLNLSITDILSDVGGWKSLGFEHATIEQVTDLFLHSDLGNVIIYPLHYPDGYPTTGYPISSQNLIGAQSLLTLMGTTWVHTTGNPYRIGGLGLVLSETAPGGATNASYGTNTEQTEGFFFVPDGQTHFADKHPTKGNFLVRTSAVPIPASVWLFGSGLLGLIGIARRKS